ncbi:MAG: acetate--CoA ligase family protein, partial [Rhodomicrobiaceae bacterium]
MTGKGVTMENATQGLAALISPRSVAVIGASSDPTRIGGRPIAYYLQGGFEGALYPVNPARKDVQGVPAFPDLDAIPGAVDFALLAIPAAAIPEAIDACGRKGVRAVLIFSAGFAEIGTEGAALQAEIMARARSHGIRVLGPNCLGLFNAHIGHCPTFTSALQDGNMPAGRVGLITQSGAYGTHLLNMARARRIGVGIWISTGNEADVTVPGCMEYLIESGEVDAIGCYMEAVNDRDTFLRALDKARRARKPVTIMKVGTSEIGAEAAQSHTASLVGSDESFNAALHRFGAQRAATTEEMLDMLYAASLSPLPRGRKLGILTVSGGAGVLMADAAAVEGLSVPPMPEDAQQALLRSNPLSSPRNPIDVTAHALNDFGIVSDSLTAMCEQGGYDMIAAFFTSWTASPVLGPRIRDAVRDGLKGQTTKPFAMVCQAGTDMLASYEADGLMIFEDPSRAIRALSRLARFAEAFFDQDGEPQELPDIGADAMLPGEAVGEHEAKRILARAGIAVLPEELAPDPSAAAHAAARIGFPVAMKIASPDIPHKTEVGGVALNLGDMEAVERAAEAMLASVAGKAPDARIEG